jgi:mannose-6-phosphate isomerase
LAGEVSTVMLRSAPSPFDADLASLRLLRANSDRLSRWLTDDAYPRWWSDGADRINGGFHERLQLNAIPTNEPRRARLHPRQMFSFSLADDLGHDGLAELATRHALSFFVKHYIRDDHFIRASVGPEGAIVDDSVVLYDQAFALLGYAAAFDVFTDESLCQSARSLLTNVQCHLINHAGGYKESQHPGQPLTTNSHMHLFEAALAWLAVDHDGRWRSLAEQLMELVLAKFIDAATGQIREFFTPEWNPVPGPSGNVVEPGHQFEWAWLLLRWFAITNDARASKAAFTLIEAAERRGVDPARGVALNSLSIDGKIRDGRARLWPQTERLKAACIAWEITRQPDYCEIACRATIALERYLQTPKPGLWHDTLSLKGEFVDEPAPASSLYHIVAAVAELSGALHRVAVVSPSASKKT